MKLKTYRETLGMNTIQYIKYQLLGVPDIFSDEEFKDYRILFVFILSTLVICPWYFPYIVLKRQRFIKKVRTPQKFTITISVSSNT